MPAWLRPCLKVLQFKWKLLPTCSFQVWSLISQNVSSQCFIMITRIQREAATARGTLQKFCLILPEEGRRELKSPRRETRSAAYFASKGIRWDVTQSHSMFKLIPVSADLTACRSKCPVPSYSHCFCHHQIGLRLSFLTWISGGVRLTLLACRTVGV